MRHDHQVEARAPCPEFDGRIAAEQPIRLVGTDVHAVGEKAPAQHALVGVQHGGSVACPRRPDGSHHQVLQ